MVFAGRADTVARLRRPSRSGVLARARLPVPRAMRFAGRDPARCSGDGGIDPGHPDRRACCCPPSPCSWSPTPSAPSSRAALRERRPASRALLDRDARAGSTRCTPTRLLTWLDCPRRYRFSYLDRPAPAEGAAVGAHQPRHVACTRPWPRWWRPAAAASGRRARRPRWSGRAWVREGFRDDEQSEQVRERAAAGCAATWRTSTPATEPLGVERTVSAPTATLVLSGRVDRIDERPDGSVVVVDYKTGRRPPGRRRARARLALAVYAVAAARTLRRPCAVVELHHLPTRHGRRREPRPGSLARKVAEAESIAREARAADEAYAAGRHRREAAFPARPSSLCSWCDFRGVCAEGRAAGPAAPSRGVGRVRLRELPGRPPGPCVRAGRASRAFAARRCGPSRSGGTTCLHAAQRRAQAAQAHGGGGVREARGPGQLGQRVEPAPPGRQRRERQSGHRRPTRGGRACRRDVRRQRRGTSSTAARRAAGVHSSAGLITGSSPAGRRGRAAPRRARARRASRP